MKLNKLIIVGLSSLLFASTVSAKPDKKKGPKGPKKSFEELDTDKDGKISEVEFIDGRKNEAKAKERFKKKDKDADGFLNKTEFAKKGKGKKGPKKPKKPKKDKPEEEKEGA